MPLELFLHEEYCFSFMHVYEQTSAKRTKNVRNKKSTRIYTKQKMSWLA